MKNTYTLLLAVIGWAVALVPLASAHQTEAFKVLPSDGAPGDNFGFAVGMDMDTLVVGAPLADNPGIDTGAAYVFTASGTTWTQQVKLHPSWALAGDNFGHSVGISGQVVVVGAPLHQARGPRSGAIFIFERSGTVWTEVAQINASDGQADAEFGKSVAISGSTIIVGTSAADKLYVVNKNGATWSEDAILTGSDTIPGDEFGFSVAIDGDSAIVGAPDRDDLGTDSGACYVLRAQRHDLERDGQADPDQQQGGRTVRILRGDLGRSDLRRGSRDQRSDSQPGRCRRGVRVPALGQRLDPGHEVRPFQPVLGRSSGRLRGHRRRQAAGRIQHGRRGREPWCAAAAQLGLDPRVLLHTGRAPAPVPLLRHPRGQRRRAGRPARNLNHGNDGLVRPRSHGRRQRNGRRSGLRVPVAAALELLHRQGQLVRRGLRSLRTRRRDTRPPARPRASRSSPRVPTRARSDSCSTAITVAGSLRLHSPEGGFLCINAPIGRSPALIASGGTPGLCDSSFTIDMNTFAHGLLGGNPKPYLLVPGEIVRAQFWGRDNVQNGIYVTEAWEYKVIP